MDLSAFQEWLAVSNIASSVLLLIVTFINVVLTHRISKANIVSAAAAQESAELTRRTADSAERGVEMNLGMITEMRTQRISAVQPLVVGQVDSIVHHKGMTEIACFALQNVGNGPALNIIGTLSIGGIDYTSEHDGFAQPIVVLPPASPRVSVQLSAPREQLAALDPHRLHTGWLAMTYQDIYGRNYEASIPLLMNPSTESLVVTGGVMVRVYEENLNKH